MQFLADESCDFAVVRIPRNAGHDVVSVAEKLRGASDEEVIDLAASERRILITEDKDFGQLVFAAARANSGVVFVRYPLASRNSLAEALLQLVSSRGDALYSCFVVVEPGKIRVTRTV